MFRLPLLCFFSRLSAQNTLTSNDYFIQTPHTKPKYYATTNNAHKSKKKKKQEKKKQKVRRKHGEGVALIIIKIQASIMKLCSQRPFFFVCNFLLDM